MESVSKHFKCIMLVECILGIATVTLIYSKWTLTRKVYSILILALIVFNLINYLLSSRYMEREENLTYLHVLASRPLCIYMVIVTFLSPDTQWSLMFELGVAAKFLDSEKDHVPRNRTQSFMILIVVMVHVAHSLVYFYGGIYYLNPYVGHMIPRTIHQLAFNVFFNTFKCCLFSGLSLCLFRCYDTYKAINDEASTIQKALNQEIVLQRRRVSMIFRPRYAWGEDVAGKLRLLRDCQASLFHVEHSLTARYRVYLVWLTMLSAVVSPYVFITFFTDRSLVTFKLSSLMYLASILVLVVVTSLVQGKKSLLTAHLGRLAAYSSEDVSRRSTRRQLLACHHRSSVFTCYFFDVDVPLLASILDICLLVVCAVLGA